MSNKNLNIDDHIARVSDQDEYIPDQYPYLDISKDPQSEVPNMKIMMKDGKMVTVNGSYVVYLIPD